MGSLTHAPLRRVAPVVALVLALSTLLQVAPAGAADAAATPYLVTADGAGDVVTIGDSPFLGSLADTDVTAAVVDMAATSTGAGYLIATDDGGVHTFGDATFHGSMGGTPLNSPIVAIATTPTGNGYWLAAADGGIFAFGDATFHGSMGGTPLNSPIVAAATTPTGNGYWLAAADGGIFAFGDATFHGSMGGTPLNSPIASVTAMVDGAGYWLAAADGGIFSFGAAPFHGSLGGRTTAAPTVDVDTAPDGNGYWLVDAAGTITAFGSAPPITGVAAGAEEPVVGLAMNPDGTGGWLATSPVPDTWTGVPVPLNSGSGRRIVYSNSAQRVWLVGADGVVEDSWLVSGRRGVPNPGTYSVFSKSPKAWAGHDGITMAYMVRFTRGRHLAIGFHSIPTSAGGQPLQTDAQLGTFRSAGCVRQRLSQAKQLYDWAPIGTVVIVLP